MINGSSEAALTFRHMTSGDRHDAFELLSELLVNDEYARDSGVAYTGSRAGREATEAALGAALALFIDRPDYGFIWMAFENGKAVGCVAVSYAISASLGKVVASLDDLVVAPAHRRRGIGYEMVEALVAELRGAEVARLDVDVHMANESGKAFYGELGFKPTREERLTLVLE